MGQASKSLQYVRNFIYHLETLITQFQVRVSEKFKFYTSSVWEGLTPLRNIIYLYIVFIKVSTTNIYYKSQQSVYRFNSNIRTLDYRVLYPHYRYTLLVYIPYRLSHLITTYWLNLNNKQPHGEQHYDVFTMAKCAIRKGFGNMYQPKKLTWRAWIRFHQQITWITRVVVVGNPYYIPLHTLVMVTMEMV